MADRGSVRSPIPATGDPVLRELIRKLMSDEFAGSTLLGRPTPLRTSNFSAVFGLNRVDLRSNLSARMPPASPESVGISVSLANVTGGSGTLTVYAAGDDTVCGAAKESFTSSTLLVTYAVVSPGVWLRV